MNEPVLVEGQRLVSQNRSGYFRTNLSEDGTKKLCTGPGHDRPTWLPATLKYFYPSRSKGKSNLSARCRLCCNWPKLKSPGLSGYIPAVQARPFYIEAVNRVGMMELSRRSGIDDRVIRQVIRGTQLYVQKRSFRAILLALISMRRKAEARHRDSIHYGALARKAKGSKVKVGSEKPVRDRSDLYRPHGDDDNERKRANLRSMTPEQHRAHLEKDRRRKRKSHE